MAGECTHEKIQFLVIGAFFGLLPSLILSFIQYRQQQHQLIFERSFTVMKDFSNALNANEVLEKLDVTDDAFDELSRYPDSSKRADEAHRALRDSEVALDRYVENVRTAGIPMNIVFHEQFPVFQIQYSSHLRDLTKPPPTRAETIRICKDAVRIDEQMRSELAAYEATSQKTLEKLASEVE